MTTETRSLAAFRRLLVSAPVESGLSGSSGKLSDTGDSRYSRLAAWPMAPSSPSLEWKRVLVPVGRRLVHGQAHLLPVLETPPLQGQTPQHLAPWLDQVRGRRLLGLGDKLPPGIRQGEQEHVRRSMRLQIVHDREHQPHVRRQPAFHRAGSRASSVDEGLDQSRFLTLATDGEMEFRVKMLEIQGTQTLRNSTCFSAARPPRSASGPGRTEAVAQPRAPSR